MTNILMVNIFRAVCAGDYVAVNTALNENPKSINYRDGLGYTPAMCAVEVDDIEMLKHLATWDGFDATITDHGGRDLHTRAILNGNTEMARLAYKLMHPKQNSSSSFSVLKNAM